MKFAEAETGALYFVENESNGRVCRTVPPVPIADIRNRKSGECLSDVPALLSRLARSATGQPTTT
ncbi:LUD domain-containing protein [Terasakiella sp. A23]|uniref:LUD domain-containing protein n=1 Tax=Terasakiella sp. FCG-A23 TaxID=3080561 RepID=UPI0039872591